MFDSHCHLTDLDDPLGGLLSAQSAGVRSVLTCGYDPPSNAAVIALRTRVPDLPIALGLHPWFAHQDVAPILELIERQRPDVVGELGLDLWGDTPMLSLDRQMHVLDAQLQLARRLDLPVTVHSRKAIEAVLSALRNHPGVRGALHAYSGSWEQLRPFLDAGFYLGIGGAITRDCAKRLHRVARAAPLDRIVVETDSPAIGMDIVEPPHVRPAHLPRVVEALARLRGMDPSELAAVTDDNAARLFGEKVRAIPRVR